MITIERIELVNVRSIGHAVVEPLTDGGLTILNGPTGAGKSSVLIGVAWALYGKTPDGVVATAMRRQNTDDECYVRVTFLRGNQRIEVTRGLKGRGRREATFLEVTADGYEQTFGKIAAGQQWIIDQLGGLSYEAFTTVIQVAQKGLDDIVKAKPAARRELIERLAGIDRMSIALKSARDETRDVRRRLEGMPGSLDQLEAAAADLNKAQDRATALWEDHEIAEQQHAATQVAYTAAETDMRVLQTALDAWQAARSAEADAQRDVTIAEAAEAATARSLRELTAAAADGTAANVEAARARHATASAADQAGRSSIDRAEQALRAATRSAATAADARRRAETAAQAAATKRAAADQATRVAADADSAALLGQVDAQQAKISDLDAKRGSLVGEYERLVKAVKAVQSATDPHCPTCSATLPDPDALIATLTEQIERVSGEGRDVKAASDAATAEITALRTAAARAADAEAAARRLTDAADAADTAAAAAAETAADAERHATEDAEAAEAAERAAGDAAANAESAAANLAQAATLLRRAENAFEAAQRLDTAAAEHDTTTKAFAAATAALKTARQKTAATSVDPDRLAQVRSAYERTQAENIAAERHAASVSADFRVAEEQVNSAERARDAEQWKLDAQRQAYADLELRQAVEDALDTFRKERIARLAPELSEIASDLLPRMTAGKYISIVLDEEFTPIVTEAGTGAQRPVTWLSGGEESVVALALRLAIREVVGGSSGGVLFLDEVLQSQDAQRRDTVMSAIRSLPGTQVVMINHIAEATDISDLVYEVTADEEHGSSIQVMGYDASAEVELAAIGG